MDPTTLIRTARRDLAAGDVARAASRYEMAFAAAPHSVAVLIGLGHCYGRLGRHAEAVALLLRAGQELARGLRRGDDGGAWCDVVLELQRIPAHREALRQVDRLLKRVPTCARGHHLRALALERLGDPEAACRAAARAHALAPGESNAAILLATLHARCARLDAARTLLEGIAARTRDPNRGRAIFELGRVLDRLGECDAAFEALQEAGRIALANPPVSQFDPEALGREIAIEQTHCTHEWFARWAAGQDAQSPRDPVFVIGFYRSGTTLLERLLDAHSGIAVAGETDLIPDLLRDLAQQAPVAGHWTVRLAALGHAGARRLRERFWRRAEALVGPAARTALFIDKTALNTLNAAFMRAVFPQARFIFALRDPRDVVLSCFMQAFVPDPLTAHFLDWERGARCYDTVLSHWHYLCDVLGFTAMPLRYEDLVADPRGALTPVLAGFDLCWEEGMARAHERVPERAVVTPSFADVARPVHREAVGRWRPYARHLERIAPWLHAHRARYGYA